MRADSADRYFAPGQNLERHRTEDHPLDSCTAMRAYDHSLRSGSPGDFCDHVGWVSVSDLDRESKPLRSYRADDLFHLRPRILRHLDGINGREHAGFRNKDFIGIDGMNDMQCSVGSFRLRSRVREQFG